MKNSKKLKLSFADDDEEEEEEDNEDKRGFKRKQQENNKNRNGKIGKKVKQNQVKLFVEDTPQSMISSGLYDEKSLLELKQAQKVTVDQNIELNVQKDVIDDAMDVEEVILVGEEAELLEKMQEDPGELTKEEKIVIQHVEEKNRKKKNQFLYNEEEEEAKNVLQRVDFDQELHNTEWEQDIMSRVGLKPEEMRNFSLERRTDSLQDFSINEILQLVEAAQQKLTSQLEEQEREFQKTTVELELCTKEIDQLNQTIESQTDNVNSTGDV